MALLHLATLSKEQEACQQMSFVNLGRVRFLIISGQFTMLDARAELDMVD